MPSCHRVRSILGAVRNHPECNQQIQSLTLPATPPRTAAVTSFESLSPIPVGIRKAQEGLHGAAWGGKLSLSNVSGSETVPDFVTELWFLNSLFLLIIISSSTFVKVDVIAY